MQREGVSSKMVGIIFPLVEIGLTDLSKCGRMIALLATPVPTALEHAAAVWWARATELWCWFLIHFLLWNQSNIEEVLQVTYFQIISFASLNLTKIPPCEIKCRQYILILMQSFSFFKKKEEKCWRSINFKMSFGRNDDTQKTFWN